MKATKKPAAFLDRDGVICEYVDLLHKKEDLTLRPGVGAAIRKLNEAGYWVFVVTNQPMLAKGLLTEEGLATIHEKMILELQKEGAQLDAIEYCPHLATGSTPPWNRDCDCRKPSPGMIDRLLARFAVDLERSFLVGDTWRDIQCAQTKGLKNYALLGGGGFYYPPESPHAQLVPDFFSDSLGKVVEKELFFKD